MTDMTKEEAEAEAKRRWGESVVLDGPQGFGLGFFIGVKNGKTIDYCGAGSSWEQCFKDADAKERLVEDVRQEAEDERKRQIAAERQRLVAPSCCAASLRTRAVTMQVTHFDAETIRVGWQLRLSDSVDSDAGLSADMRAWIESGRIAHEPFTPAPTHCPFCGDKLPELVKKASPPEPMWRPTDQYGDYCESCGERSMSCTCWPATAAYEEKK